MGITLSKLNLGKVDGKHEYLIPISDRDRAFFDAYLIPTTVDTSRIHNADITFIEGFRGTGKTSLLRWHAETKRRAGAYTNFVLFKSDLTEQQRMHISQEAGITWADVDSSTMEISQDFKSTWRWFIHHKIGEVLKADTSLADVSTENYIRLLGLNEPVFTKSLGFLPRIEGATIKVKADIPFFEMQLEGDFKKEGASGRTTLDALGVKLDDGISQLKLKRPIYVYFDELEVFFHSLEQFHRDQRMVRDLIFSIGSLNEIFRANNVAIHLIAAVRSEVLDSLGSLGQEVDRLVHDRGTTIAWHYAKRSKNHPLLDMIRRKIWASEEAAGHKATPDPIDNYFQNDLDFPIEIRLLDNSFYKPRDLVWRLTIAQRQFPDESCFTRDIFDKTETEYSSKLWDEIRYELSATYSSEEIDAIELALAGHSSGFEFSDIDQRLGKASKLFLRGRKAKSTYEVLADLYRLGAIGNSFRVGSSGTNINNRWVFRGDPKVYFDKRMVVHPALHKRLSVISPRRRGSRGGRNR